jgi:hypothetical protein
MTHRCAGCTHYFKEGISHRCRLEDNTYNTWMGMTYKEHPDQKNRKGDCKDYEEKIT